MKNIIVILLLAIFSATQFASIVSDISAPIVHAICYDKVLRHTSTGVGSQTVFMDLITFRQSKTDDREIRVGGELFDIVAVTTRGSGVLVTVNSDEIETQFFKILQQIREAAKKTSGRQHHSKQVQSWLLKLYCPNEASANLFSPALIDSPHNMPFIPALHAGIHDRHLQPPDFFI